SSLLRSFRFFPSASPRALSAPVHSNPASGIPKALEPWVEREAAREQPVRPEFRSLVRQLLQARQSPARTAGPSQVSELNPAGWPRASKFSGRSTLAQASWSVWQLLRRRLVRRSSARRRSLNLHHFLTRGFPRNRSSLR